MDGKFVFLLLDRPSNFYNSPTFERTSKVIRSSFEDAVFIIIILDRNRDFF